LSFQTLDRNLGLRRDRAMGEVLAPQKAQELVAVLTHANSRIREFDADGDGKINWTEAQARRGNDAGTQLAAGLIAEASRPAPEVADWLSALRKTENALVNRNRFHHDQGSVARFHTKTELGGEAVTWAMREKAVDGQALSEEALHQKLVDAETGFLSRLPLLGALASSDLKHLDDGEVKKMLGTGDLAAFVAETKARVETKLGMSFEDHLAGQNLPGVEQLEDPDYRAVHRKPSNPREEGP
jgi:hypothetical protein